MEVLMANFRGVSPGDAHSAGLLGMPAEVNVVRGTTATVLVRPAGAKILVARATGDFYIRMGAAGTAESPTPLTMPGTFPGGVAVTDGSAAWPIPDGQVLPMPVPGWVTVKGYAAGSELTYYWI